MGENLAYYLERFPAEPFRLDPRRATRLGRGEDNDIVVTDRMASRYHAVIYYERGSFRVRDENSGNGTYLNERRIREERIRPGDKIMIGEKVFVLTVEEESRAKEKFAEKQQQIMSDATVIGRPGKEGAEMTGAFSGYLSEVTVPEILQVLEMGKKTGKLTISTGHRGGTMFFKDGRIVSADFGRKIGEEAVYAACVLENGKFEFAQEEVDFEPTIQGSTSGLLMEAMRRMDEMKRAAGETP